MLTDEPKAVAEQAARQTVLSILLALSFTHFLNDMLQSLIPAMYPVLKDSLKLNFTQVGLITLTFQMSASILQPLVGLYTDKKPKAFSLAIGMGFSLIGLVSLSFAHTFPMLLVSVTLVGMGSAIFHPEASRLAHMASGGKHGMAQSLFQVGGNAGSSLGPLLAAMVIVPFGQFNVIWFSVAALLAIIVMINIGKWYQGNTHRIKPKKVAEVTGPAFSTGKVVFSLFILLVLIFSKYFYMASMTSYYTFYLIDKFHVSVQSAQVYLFIFLFAVAAGTFIGGPVGDRIGRKYVIWISILGVAPFSLLLPHANLFWTAVLSVFIGVILSSAFSAILVYAQELVPGKVGMIAGLFFGLAFGMAGVGSALLGKLADATSINYVYEVCAYLPLIGILTGLLPNVEKAGFTQRGEVSKEA
ncbi:MFS transporter, FSR family, fosmidomycin resistance protein [Chitinophaga terrae (ex Kim and Jung 2007)]|uniref:MFS transporter, FSR family, fosmidomycin resistance protein n=2 Tax=Chitinophaga terrae (ex Kim and Jung 2007) TaxID=408074 RepID=A0A1H3XZ03_9BACT|nr:MFS transporter, FSR family, fosmidomycin resistance protein [Chitinophaga terrae (ex Kim and Jung 2007)]